MAIFTLKTKAFAAAVKLARHAMNTRNTVPVLDCVLILPGDDRVTVYATDLERSCSVVLDAPGCVAGESFAANAPGLLAALAGMGSQVQMVGPPDDGGDYASLSDGHGGTAAVECVAAADYPILDAAKTATEWRVPTAELARLFSKTAFAVSTEETRYYLQGVYLHSRGGALCAVATDGHRLAMAESDAAAPPVHTFEGFSQKGVGVIVPRQAVTHVLAALKVAPGEVTLRICTGERPRFEVSWPGVTIVSKLIDATFPEYDRVIPQEADRTARVTLDSKAFASVCTAASKIADRPPLRLDLDGGGQLTASVMHDGAQVLSRRLDVTNAENVPSLGLYVGFEARYLRDLCKLSPRLRFCFGEGSIANKGPAPFPASVEKACLILDPDDASVRFVLMPRRLR